MQERMRGVLIIFSAAFLFIVIPALFLSIHNAPIDYHTQTLINVITPAGQYSANITLSLPLYGDSILNVQSCSSNTTGDSPTASHYNPTGYQLELSGLIDNSTRTLSVEYGVTSDITKDIPALQPILITVAWLFIFAGIAMLAAGILIIFNQI